MSYAFVPNKILNSRFWKNMNLQLSETYWIFHCSAEQGYLSEQIVFACASKYLVPRFAGNSPLLQPPFTVSNMCMICTRNGFIVVLHYLVINDAYVRFGTSHSVFHFSSLDKKYPHNESLKMFKSMDTVYSLTVIKRGIVSH